MAYSGEIPQGSRFPATTPSNRHSPGIGSNYSPKFLSFFLATKSLEKQPLRLTFLLLPRNCLPKSSDHPTLGGATRARVPPPSSEVRGRGLGRAVLCTILRA